MVKESKKIILFLGIFLFILLITNFKSVSGEIISEGNFTYDHCAKIFDNNTVVAYWKLNETSGINVYDSTGNNHNGTLVNMDDSNWVSGKLNNSLYFDGVNELVNCNNLSITNDSPFSIEAWINLTKVNGFKTIMGKYDASEFKGWVFYLDRRQLSFVRQEHSSSFFTFQASTNLVAINDWTHVVYTSSGLTGDKNELYVDGVPSADSGIGFGSPLDFQSPLVNLTIGYSELTGYFRGEIDNILLYNVELTHSEVISQYNKSYGIEAYPDGDIPCYSNLTEITDPLHLIQNETIQINLYDSNNITSVLIEYNGNNYTMTNTVNNMWSNLGNWKPSSVGLKWYKIWVSDNRGNIGYYLFSITVYSLVEITLSLTVLVFLVFIMIWMFLKDKRFLIMLTILLFSVIFTFASFTIILFPFSPFLQTLFLFIQVILFMITTIKMNHKKR